MLLPYNVAKNYKIMLSSFCNSLHVFLKMHIGGFYFNLVNKPKTRFSKRHRYETKGMFPLHNNHTVRREQSSCNALPAL